MQGSSARGLVIAGELLPADAVILAQDTLAAIDNLFEPGLNEPWALRMRQNTTPVLNTFISLGIEADLSEIPEYLLFVTDRPLMCGGRPVSVINVNNYAGYRGYAPEGCTALTSIVMGDTYDFWRDAEKTGVYMA